MPNDVALVTGAGRRLGRAIALGLGVERRMRVAVHYWSAEDGARAVVEAINLAGGEARLFAADLRIASEVSALVPRVIESYGRLDVLVNSAASMMITPVADATVEQWDEIFALNLRAPFFLSQAAAPHLAPGGTIVNIADLAAYEVWPKYVPHGTSKAGIVHATRGLARALAPIRINAVAPGAILLPDHWGPETSARLAASTPLRRIGAPEDVVAAVNYLIDATYMTGQTILVDGGRSVRS